MISKDDLCTDCCNASDGFIVNSQDKETTKIKLSYCGKCYEKTDTQFKGMFDFISK